MEETLASLFENATGYVVVAIPFIKRLVDYLKNTFELKGLALNLMPMLVGLVSMILLGLYLDGDIVTFAIGGIIAGLGSSGYHDITKTPIDKGVTNNG